MASYEKGKGKKPWSVRFRETVNDVEKNKRLSGFATKKEAQEAYTRYMVDKHAVVPESGTQALKFDKLVEEYLRFKKSRVKASTYHNLEVCVTSAIMPYFKAFKVADIKPIDVLKWQDTLSKLAVSTIKAYRVRFMGILNYAETYYDIRNNAAKAENVKGNSGKKDELHVWTKEQFQHFVAVCDTPKYAMLFRFLYIVGCRIGEALALGWADIDLGSGIVTINKSVSSNGQATPWAITTPKNKSSNRRVDIPQPLCEQLKDYKKWQADTVKNTDFIFCGDRPISINSAERALKRYAAFAELPQIRVHDLRHSCASYLISQGVSIVAVSKRLGHANVTQTLNTYSHVMEEDSKKISTAFSEF